jgi:hypothetical protein
MPPDNNRLAVPTLVGGLHVVVVVKPRGSSGSLLFFSSRELASLAVQRAPCLPNPLSMAVKAPSMPPAVPGRRFGATAFQGLEGWPLYRDLRAAAAEGWHVSAAVPCCLLKRGPRVRSFIVVSVRLV